MGRILDFFKTRPNRKHKDEIRFHSPEKGRIERRAREIVVETEMAVEMLCAVESNPPSVQELLAQELLRTREALADARKLAGLSDEEWKALSFEELDVAANFPALVFLKSVDVRQSAYEYGRKQNANAEWWRLSMVVEQYLATRLARVLVSRDIERNRRN